MMELRPRHTPQSRERERTRRRSWSTTAVSIALHAVLAVVLWRALEVPDILQRLLDSGRRSRPLQEHVVYSVLPQPSAPAAAPTRARPARERQAVPPPALVAPREVPSELPPVPPAKTPAAQPEAGAPGGTGPLGGGVGPTRGVRPSYTDPRVWVRDPALIYAPKTETERLDSAVASTLASKLDSLRANSYSPNKFERGDWTAGSGDRKWGIDQQYIHLGRFSLPTALLALLPLNRMQANPIEVERQRNAAFMRDDIMYHAQAALNEAEFRKAVKAIRERKDRERKAAQEKKKKDGSGPIASPGNPPR